MYCTGLSIFDPEPRSDYTGFACKKQTKPAYVMERACKETANRLPVGLPVRLIFNPGANTLLYPIFQKIISLFLAPQSCYDKCLNLLQEGQDKC